MDYGFLRELKEDGYSHERIEKLIFAEKLIKLKIPKNTLFGKRSNNTALYRSGKEEKLADDLVKYMRNPIETKLSKRQITWVIKTSFPKYIAKMTLKKYFDKEVAEEEIKEFIEENKRRPEWNEIPHANKNVQENYWWEDTLERLMNEIAK